MNTVPYTADLQANPVALLSQELLNLPADALFHLSADHLLLYTGTLRRPFRPRRMVRLTGIRALLLPSAGPQAACTSGGGTP